MKQRTFEKTVGNVVSNVISVVSNDSGIKPHGSLMEWSEESKYVRGEFKPMIAKVLGGQGIIKISCEKKRCGVKKIKSGRKKLHTAKKNGDWGKKKRTQKKFQTRGSIRRAIKTVLFKERKKKDHLL